MGIDVFLIPLLALALALAGLNLLYLSWRRRLESGRCRWTGWFILLLSLVVWSVWAGPEFGIAAGVCIPGMVALGHVAWHTRHGRRNGRNGNGRSDTALLSPAPEGSLMLRSVHHLWRFLLVVPFASLAAFFVTLGLVMLLPWTELSRLAFLVIAAPALWGLMAAWLCSDDRQWRPLLVILGLALISLPTGLGVL